MIKIVNGVIITILTLSNIAFADEIDTLVPKIIKIESNGDPHAVGEDGEIGLMQLSPILVKEFNENSDWDKRWVPGSKGFYPMPLVEIDFKNGNVNREIGTWYLKRLKNHYIPPEKYSVELLLACYNFGPTAMRKLGWDWKRAPESTLRYIRKVLE